MPIDWYSYDVAHRPDLRSCFHQLISIKFVTPCILLILCAFNPVKAQTLPDYGKTASFAIVAGTTVTGAAADTVTGDIGISPGSALTGFPPGVILNGQLYSGAASLAGQAEISAYAVYDDLVNQPAPLMNNLTGLVLGAAGSDTYTPGVYYFTTTAQLTGTLTLNDGGDPNAIYIFKIGTSFNSATGAKVKMTSGGYGKNVFWVMGSSATMGVGTSLAGNMVAHTSVSMASGAYSSGKILALTGAVTIDGTNVDAFPVATTRVWLGGSGQNAWNNPANWYGKTVPSATMDVDLNSPLNLVVSTPSTVNNLILNNNGIVLAVAAGSSLQVKGNLSLNGGTITTAAAFPPVTGATDVSTGTVIFTGKQAQVIPSLTYNNLEIDNPGINVASGNITVSNNLILKNGTLDMGAYTLIVNGKLTDSAAMITSRGLVMLSGTQSQTLAGTAFTNSTVTSLTINNAAGVTLTSPLRLSGILTCQAGTFTTGGLLLLTSTAAATAVISGKGSGQISGLVSLQRYLNAAYGYKYFSPPFSNIAVGSFASAVKLQSVFPGFYSYNENQMSSGFNIDTAATSMLQPLHGYAANLGIDSLPLTLTLTGLPNTGPLSIAVGNNKWPSTTGFNLVGNPYPSPIDWNAQHGWSNKNVDNALYFFDSGSSGQYYGTYSTYVNGISSDGNASNIIGAMQGFFIHVTAGLLPVTGAYAMNDSVRVDSLKPYFHKSTLNLNPELRGLIRISAGYASHRADQLVAYEDAAATGSFNPATDALKLMNSCAQIPSLYLMGADTARISIKAVTDLKTTPSMPLGLQTRRSGVILFRLTGSAGVLDQLVEFTDQLTGLHQIMQPSGAISILLKKGIYEGRFSLKLLPRTIMAENKKQNSKKH